MPQRPRHPTGFVRRHPGTATVRWQGIVKYPDPDDPRRWQSRSATFAKRAEAQAWVDRTLAEHREHPAWRPPSEETLASFLDRWLDDVASGRLRPQSLRRYRQAAAHVKGRIGDKPLALLRPLDLQGLYTALAHDGQAPRTVAKAHIVLHRALRDAVDWGLIPSNAADKARPPKPPVDPVAPPTPAEAAKLLRAAEADRLHALWAFLALTGARKGEALALRWEDIDWQRRTARIQRTMIGDGAGRAVQASKSAAGARTVALSSYLLRVLRQHQRRQREERLAAGPAWTESGYVFTSRRGTWLRPSNVHRAFKSLLKAAGLRATSTTSGTRWRRTGSPRAYR